MKQQSYPETVGLTRANPISYDVIGDLIACPLADGSDDAVDHAVAAKSLFADLLKQQQFTLLDDCLWSIDSEGNETKQHEVHITTPREVIVIAPLELGEPEPVIYPPPASKQKLSPCDLPVPLFQVNYIFEQVPNKYSVMGLSLSLNQLRQEFEGNLMCNLLMKAVRSQRNVVTSPSMSTHALAIGVGVMAKENVSPCNLILMPEAMHDSVGDYLVEHEGVIFDMTPRVFMPSKRNYDRRSYILPDPNLLGTCVKTESRLSTEPVGNDAVRLEISLKMGALISHRDLIVGVDIP